MDDTGPLARSAEPDDAVKRGQRLIGCQAGWSS